MSPPAVTQNFSNTNQTWQSKSSSAALNTNRFTNFPATNDDITNKHTVWPTQNHLLNTNESLPKPFLFKSSNFPAQLTEQDQRMLNAFRRPKAVNHLREITLPNGHL